MEIHSVYTGMLSSFTSTTFTYRPPKDKAYHRPGVLYISQQFSLDDLSVLDIAAFFAFSLGLLEVDPISEEDAIFLQSEDVWKKVKAALAKCDMGLPRRSAIQHNNPADVNNRWWVKFYYRRQSKA